MGSNNRATRSGGSLRMQSRIAVDATIGSSPRTRQATGVTAATGSAAERMITKPIAAFQKPITYQGSVTANSTIKTRSSVPIPPGESANAASQMKPAIVAATQMKKTAGRHAERMMDTAAALSPEERSSMAEGIA